MAIKPIVVDTYYLKYYIESNVCTLKRKAKSMIPGIERNSVLNLAMALPPLNEQKRIVEKLEELIALSNLLISE